MARRQAREDLAEYRAKRRFGETPEPEGGRHGTKRGKRGLYTIQKHDARRLHYDLRLELDGVLKSWAVTRGPSLDPADKRLAVRTEDHPLDYATFEGVIPAGHYGAGTVLLWDQGSWEPVGDPRSGLEGGKLAFHLDGERLKGRWALVRMRARKGERRENWLLIKEVDGEAVRVGGEITERFTDSVASNRDLAAITRGDGAGPPAEKRKAKGGKKHTDALPGFVEPQLATLVDEVPEGGDWLYELKFDGYRALAAASGEAVRINTRSGHDWTDRFAGIARDLAALDLDGALLDGEVVVIHEGGRTDFGALQRAMKGEDATPVYFAFDLLALGGKSLRARPLRERKKRLSQLLKAAPADGLVHYGDHMEGEGRAIFDALCEQRHEGLIAKQADAPYRSGRGRSWLKVKCGRQQEFVVVGWSPSSKERAFSSLLLAVRDGRSWIYAGRVGSGFAGADLEEIAGRLSELERDERPVKGEVPAAIARTARWAEPKLVVEVAFAEFTRDGLVRQARFLGLREDKPAAEIGRERAESLEGRDMARTKTREAGDGVEVAGIRLSNPERVLFPEQGVTKLELARYFEAAAERMLPHVERRLVSLVRCPEGQAKQCFFQRHGGAGLPDAFRTVPVAKKDGGQEDYLYLTDVSGLVASAQIGVLELHVWGCRIDEIDRPDRLVFDLDPDPSVGFGRVRETAFMLRDALEALGLKSFALLTGGKGVHVVAPLLRRHDWPTVKAFSGALARRFAEDEPDRYVATMSKKRREGRIFIDHFRNERGSTAIAPYSPRARAGAPIAWPVAWDALAETAAGNAVSVEGAARKLGEADPWPDYFDLRQSLKASALKALGLD